MIQPPEHLWLVVGRPASADAVKWVADLVAENARLREALELGVEILTSPDMQQWRYVESGDMHFDVGVWVNAARRALGGEP